MWAQLGNIGTGIWLMASPALLSYSGAAATTDRIIGPIVAAIAWIAASECTRGVRWLNLPCGVALVGAPLLMEYGASSTLNSIVCGLLVTSLSTVKGSLHARIGEGWRVLVEK